jgi:cytochrome c oxidase subunit II
MNKNIWWVTLLVLVVALLVAACGSSRPGMMGRFNRDFGRTFDSNGEQIYFTSTSQRGTPITFDMPEGGMMGRGMRDRMPMMRGGMMSCADCHGSDGRGGRVQMMMATFTAPDIRWESLTAEDHAHGPGDDHDGEMGHPAYTEETLRRAIVQGVDPAGEPLDWPMPRWRMSEEELNDLINFIKTLE